MDVGSRSQFDRKRRSACCIQVLQTGHLNH
ncbi:hypothetical protein BSF40_41700 [Pseudomonas sp. ACN5]|nr:hypothetical protein BSF40_41700 [Pseudomonas sp. ACN5]